MRDSAFKKTATILEIALLLFSGIYLTFFLYTGYTHLKYPFDLEWIEGGYLLQCLRIAEGYPIYISPENAEFIPYFYTPLYFYVTGYLGKIFGVNYFLGRGVSYFSIILTCILMSIIVFRETRSKIASFLAPAIFLSAYSFTGFWYDIVRSDSLCLLLIIISFYLILFKGNSYFVLILSSLILVLAFLTKQPAIYFIGFSPVAFLFNNYKKTILMLFSSLFFSLLIILPSNIITKGWFLYYVYDLPSGNEFIPSLFYHIIWTYIIKGLPFFMILLLIVFFTNLKESRNFLKSEISIWFWGLFSSMTYFVSSMVYPGGYVNGLIPLVCFLSMISSTTLYKLSPGNKIRCLLYILLILQVVIFSYNPRSQIPTKNDYNLGNRFLNMMSSVESDEIFVYLHSFYPVMCGKKHQIHFGAVHDALRLKTRVLPEAFYNKFRNRTFAMVILDNKIGEENPSGIDRLIIDNYYFSHKIFNDYEEGFYTKTGSKSRPNFLYLPRNRSLGLFEKKDTKTDELPVPKGVIKIELPDMFD